MNIGNTEVVKRNATSPLCYNLSPENLAQLAADPARRALWQDLMVHTLLPLLRELVPVLQTKVRTNRGYFSLSKTQSCSTILCVVVSTRKLTPVVVRALLLQFHFAELEKPDVLNKMLPGLGHDWTEIFAGSQAHIFQTLIAYAMEWEMVVS
jgi:hypothetical protein